jgi:hypothetical protein
MKKFATLICAASMMVGAAWAEGGVSLPAGIALKMKLETTLTTSNNKVGDPFSGRLTEAVVLDGKTVVPIGTTVEGRLTRVTEPRRIAGRPTIGILPENLVLPNGEKYVLNATLVDTNRGGHTDVNEEGQFKGEGHTNIDTVEVAAGTGTGMLAGGLIGGGKGVLIGGLIGATVTTGHWLMKHNSAYLPAGTELVMELDRPLEMSPATGGQ